MFENLGTLIHLIQHGPTIKKKMHELHNRFAVDRHSGFSEDKGIEIIVDGIQKLIGFKVDPQWLPGKSAEDVERALTAAYIDASTRSRAIMEDEIRKATAGIPVPMLDNLMLGGAKF